MAKKKKKSAKPTNKTQEIKVPKSVKKKEDYIFFVELVKDGLWKNNTYMAELCSVDRETISAWKKTQPVISARKKSARVLVSNFKHNAGLERKMREGGMEIDNENKPGAIRVIIEEYGSTNKDKPTAEAGEGDKES